jgi:hypothetical protein
MLTPLTASAAQQQTEPVRCALYRRHEQNHFHGIRISFAKREYVKAKVWPSSAIGPMSELGLCDARPKKAQVAKKHTKQLDCNNFYLNVHPRRRLLT